MRLLTLAYPAASDFLAAYDAASGSLVAQTKTEATIGEQLLVEIAFPRLPNRPLLRASVLGSVDGGLRLKLDEADASTRDFLVKMAKGELKVEETTHREHKRFPTALPVRFLFDSVVHTSMVEDLSAGGCFVRAARPPVVGSKVTLDITAPEDEPLHLTGLVAWVRGGDDAGFGVEFDAPESADGKRLRIVLRKALGTGDVPLEK